MDRHVFGAMTAGILISVLPFGWFASATGAGGGGASQQPAVIALIIGVVSAVAAGYNIFQQVRRDRATETAAASSVANDASKTSFEQLMATSRYQGERIIGLERDLAACEGKLDLEQVETARLKADNRRLMMTIESLGGK